MENFNLIFNKLYYENLGKENFSDSLKKWNTQIFNTGFDYKRDYKALAVPHQSFVLKTTYPGLLIGTGNPHGTGQSDDDINMGFSFDYVSGQPYIPGSSVKGMLRNYFDNAPEVIKELLGNNSLDVKALTKEMFDDDKDVFFDAVLYDGNEYGLVMGEDYITPHKEATKNPIPIKLIKILPDVRFEFRFSLNNGLISAEEKRELFSTLLQVFGIGAKTNVGYGALVIDDKGGKITEKKELPSTNYNLKSQNNKPQGEDKQANNQNGGNSERIKCPHCGEENWKYFKDGGRRNKCYKCHEFLFPKK